MPIKIAITMIAASPPPNTSGESDESPDGPGFWLKIGVAVGAMVGSWLGCAVGVLVGAGGGPAGGWTVATARSARKTPGAGGIGVARLAVSGSASQATASWPPLSGAAAAPPG